MKEQKENQLSSGRPVRNTKRLNYGLLNKGTIETKNDCVEESSDIKNKSKSHLARMDENSDTNLLQEKPSKKPKRKNGQKEKAKSSKTVVNGQKGMAKSPKTVVNGQMSKSPKTVVHRQKEMAKSPKTVVNGQKEKAKSPKTVVNGQKEMAKSPQTVVNGQKETTKSPKTVIHRQKETTKSPKTVVNGPKEMTKSPKTVIHRQKETTKSPKTAVNHNPIIIHDLTDEIEPHLETKTDQQKRPNKKIGQKVMAKKVKVVYNPKIVHTITDQLDITDEIDLHLESKLDKSEKVITFSTISPVEVKLIKMDNKDRSTYSPNKKLKSSSNVTVMKTNFEKVPEIVEDLELKLPADDKDNSTKKTNSNKTNCSSICSRLRDRGSNNNTVKEVKETPQCCSKQSYNDTKPAAKGSDDVVKKTPSTPSRACKEKEDIGDESEEESKKELKEQKDLIVKLNNFFNTKQLNLKPRSPTRADGNCWFRSILDQLQLHQVPDQPTTHKQLRIEVSNFLNHLPDNIAQDMINVIFKGKRQGLKSLAYRQKKLGQFVDDNGIMVIATGLYVGRWIHVHREDLDGRHRVLKFGGGDGSENFDPLTVFYFKDQQHYQSICKTD